MSTKIGELIGPNAKAKVELRDGFAIELRTAGKRLYPPLSDGPGWYEIDIGVIGNKAPPAKYFPTEFFEVDAKQAVANMAIQNTSQIALRMAWGIFRKEWPDRSIAELSGVFREAVAGMMLKTEIPDKEFLSLMPDAIDFAVSNFLAEEAK